MRFTGFRPPRAPRARDTFRDLPSGAPPSRAFPSRGSRARVAASPCPLAVPHPASDGATSRLCSAGESVASARRCRLAFARCSPGLPCPGAPRSPCGSPPSEDRGTRHPVPAGLARSRKGELRLQGRPARREAVPEGPS